MCSEYTRTYVLVKSVESKVPSALEYDVARSFVGCPLMCRPLHLTRVLNYEAYMAVLKLYLRIEIGSRKCLNRTKPGVVNTENEHNDCLGNFNVLIDLKMFSFTILFIFYHTC